MKPWMKWAAIIGGGILLLIVGIAIGTAGGDSVTTTTGTTTTTTQTESTPVAEETSDGYEYADDEPVDEGTTDQTNSDDGGPAAVGETFVYSDDTGMELEITLLKTARVGKLADDYGDLVHGELYGVKFKLKNTGTEVYDDWVTNCVTLIDTHDQSVDPSDDAYNEDYDPLPGCLQEIKLTPGDVRQGWVHFNAKSSKKFRLAQYSPNSGWSEATAEWSLQ